MKPPFTFFPRAMFSKWLTCACFLAFSANSLATNGYANTNRVAIHGIVPVVVQVDGNASAEGLNARVAALEGRVEGLVPSMMGANMGKRWEDLSSAIKEMERSCREQVSSAEQTLKEDYEKAYSRLREHQEKGEKHLDCWLKIFATLVGALPIGIALIQWLAGQWRFRQERQDVQQTKMRLQNLENDFKTAISQMQAEKDREIAQLARDGVQSMSVPFSTLILLTDLLGQGAGTSASPGNFMLVLVPTVLCFHRLLSQGLKIKDADTLRQTIKVFDVFSKHWKNHGTPQIVTAWKGALSSVKRSMDKDGVGWDKTQFAELLGENSAEFRWLESFYYEMDDAVRVMGRNPLGRWKAEGDNSSGGESRNA